MVQRVRAILVTPDNNLLLIKRVRPGIASYWVLPGGHVEDEDGGLEAALAREIQEEVAGVPDIAALLRAAVLGGSDGHGLFDLPDLRSTEPAS